MFHWIVYFVFSQIYRGVSWWGPRARLFFHDTQTHASSIRQTDFQTGGRDSIQHHPQLAHLHTQPSTQRWGLLGDFCQILIIFNFKNHAIMNKRFTWDIVIWRRSSLLLTHLKQSIFFNKICKISFLFYTHCKI